MSELNSPQHLLEWEHADSFGLQLRWGSHQPESFDAVDHLDLFGNDANNLWHGIVQQQIHGYLARRMELSPKDVEFFELLGLYHDLGECIAAGSESGDEDWHTKSAAAEAAEHDLFGRIIYTDPHFAGLGSHRERMLATMHDGKKNPPETLDGLMHDAGERLGYMRTAMNVARRVPPDGSRLSLLPQNELSRVMNDRERGRIKMLYMEVLGQHVFDLHRRHVASGTEHPLLDVVVQSELALQAESMLDVMRPLNKAVSHVNFYRFQHDKAAGKLQATGTSAAQVAEQSDVLAERKLANFRASVEILQNL